MTTIRALVENYLKKNHLQAYEFPGNQKTKKLGAIKSLFGYRLFLCLALGILIPLKAAGGSVLSCMLAPGIYKKFDSSGRMIGRIKVRRNIADRTIVTDSKGRPKKFTIGDGLRVYKIPRWEGLDGKWHKTSYIEIGSCVRISGSDVLSAAATRDRPRRRNR